MYILVTYVTAGAGHRRAAEAITEEARRQLPQAEVACVDVLEATSRWLAWVYPRLYAFLVRYLPFLWGYAYDILDQPVIYRLVQPWRRQWNRLQGKRFLQGLRARPPEVIIATHFLPADLVGSAKAAGWLTSRLIVAITDLRPHRFWLAREAEAFVLGSEATRTICLQRHLDPARLHVLGIPIDSRFTAPRDRVGLVRKLGFDPARRTVLIASGGMGLGPILQMTNRFLASEAAQAHLQLLVVCGYNQRLADHLQQATQHAPMPVRVFGFVDSMHELMGASDLLLTKAGGLTVMEALAVGVPLLFCEMVPGQERLNAEYAVRHGAAVIAPDAACATELAVQLLLDEPDRLLAMRRAVATLGAPGAARELIARLVVGEQNDAT